MADISASKVMELRQRTGLGMMECKKALTEAGGDMTKAEDLLRIKSGAKASKAADRIAAEGVIGLWVAPDAKIGCDGRGQLRNRLRRARTTTSRRSRRKSRRWSHATTRPTWRRSARRKLASGDTVEARSDALVQKIGENMSIRRFVRREAKGTLASYVHGVKIGVLADVAGGDGQLGKDLAMHIAALKPLAVDKSGIAPEMIAKEREIAAAQVAEEGKTGDMAAKIIEGKVNKALATMTLSGQAFVKGDGKQTVEQLVKSKGATVQGFTLYVVGEGIDKKKDDFAAEVAAMAKV